MTLTIGSMFSGYGGLDLAVEAVTGARPAWFCEWDDAPSRILAHHWPHVTNYRDVTAVDWATVPPVDIITGGSPCQDLSLAGARRGMTDGTRSNLWVSMREAIAIIRPRLVVWENVKGALSAEAISASDGDMGPGAGLLGGGGGHLRALGRVLGDLATLGYDARWTTLRASDVGAPHHRERVFLIAHPADSDGVRREAERLAGGPAPTIPGDYDSDDPLAWAGGTADLMRDAHSRWGDSAPAILTWALIHGEPPLPTRDAVTYRDEDLWGHRFPEPKTELDPEWSEWMMGLPPGWVTEVPGLTRAQQLKACGNGVVPQQAAAALRHLLGEA